MVERNHYNFVYSEPFTQYTPQRDRLEEIWERFKNDHPADFKGYSLSVSDIVAIRHNGVITYHYCDSHDFKELPRFLQPATPYDGAYHIMSKGTRAFAIRNEYNLLRTAELSTEQKYNKIDGIINNQPTVAQL